MHLSLYAHNVWVYMSHGHEVFMTQLGIKVLYILCVSYTIHIHASMVHSNFHWEPGAGIGSCGGHWETLVKLYDAQCMYMSYTKAANTLILPIEENRCIWIAGEDCP